MGYAKIYEEIKRGKWPEPRKRKKKSETRSKNRQVSEVELGVQKCPLERKKMDKCPTVELGVQDTHLREKKKKKEKENTEHLILPESFKRARKVCIPSKEHK